MMPFAGLLPTARAIRQALEEYKARKRDAYALPDVDATLSRAQEIDAQKKKAPEVASPEPVPPKPSACEPGAVGPRQSELEANRLPSQDTLA